MNHCLTAGVESGEIGDDILWEKVPPKTLSDEIVWDTPKSVLQIEEGYMGCLLLLPGVLDHLFHHHVVLNTTIYARKKSLLHCRVDELVVDEIGGEARVEEEMEGFTDTPAQCDHPEVGGVCRVALLMDELHHGLPPGGGRGAHGQHLGEQGGQDVVGGLELQEHREGDAVRPGGRGLVGSLEDLPDVPGPEGARVE